MSIKNPVTHYLHPDELAKKIDLSFPENGCSLEELYESIEQYLSYSVISGVFAPPSDFPGRSVLF